MGSKHTKLDGKTGLPTFPPIDEVILQRGVRPYRGPINVGDVFAWEPDLPHARQLCIVTKLGSPKPALEIHHAIGHATIFQGDEDIVWAKDWPLHGEPAVWNDVSRFREACVPTIYKSQATERAMPDLNAVERFVSPCLPPTEHESEILTIMIEEAAEVQQRATKMLRFGIAEIQPGQPYNNAERLGEEVGDLLHMIDLAIDKGLICQHGIKRGRIRKKRQLAKYMQT